MHPKLQNFLKGSFVIFGIWFILDILRRIGTLKQEDELLLYRQNPQRILFIRLIQSYYIEDFWETYVTCPAESSWLSDYWLPRLLFNRKLNQPSLLCLRIWENYLIGGIAVVVAYFLYESQQVEKSAEEIFGCVKSILLISKKLICATKGIFMLQLCALSIYWFVFTIVHKMIPASRKFKNDDVRYSFRAHNREKIAKDNTKTRHDPYDIIHGKVPERVEPPAVTEMNYKEKYYDAKESKINKYEDAMIYRKYKHLFTDDDPIYNEEDFSIDVPDIAVTSTSQRHDKKPKTYFKRPDFYFSDREASNNRQCKRACSIGERTEMDRKGTGAPYKKNIACKEQREIEKKSAKRHKKPDITSWCGRRKQKPHDSPDQNQKEVTVTGKDTNLKQVPQNRSVFLKNVVPFINTQKDISPDTDDAKQQELVIKVQNENKERILIHKNTKESPINIKSEAFSEQEKEISEQSRNPFSVTAVRELKDNTEVAISYLNKPAIKKINSLFHDKQTADSSKKEETDYIFNESLFNEKSHANNKGEHVRDTGNKSILLGEDEKSPQWSNKHEIKEFKKPKIKHISMQDLDEFSTKNSRKRGTESVHQEVEQVVDYTKKISVIQEETRRTSDERYKQEQKFDLKESIKELEKKRVLGALNQQKVQPILLRDQTQKEKQHPNFRHTGPSSGTYYKPYFKERRKVSSSSTASPLAGYRGKLISKQMRRTSIDKMESSASIGSTKPDSPKRADNMAFTRNKSRYGTKKDVLEERRALFDKQQEMFWRVKNIKLPENCTNNSLSQYEIDDEDIYVFHGKEDIMKNKERVSCLIENGTLVTENNTYERIDCKDNDSSTLTMVSAVSTENVVSTVGDATPDDVEGSNELTVDPPVSRKGPTIVKGVIRKKKSPNIRELNFPIEALNIKPGSVKSPSEANYRMHFCLRGKKYMLQGNTNYPESKQIIHLGTKEDPFQNNNNPDAVVPGGDCVEKGRWSKLELEDYKHAVVLPPGLHDVEFYMLT